MLPIDAETLAIVFWNAVNDGNIELTKQILSQRPALFDEARATPGIYLKEAARNDDVAMLEVLVSAGANVSAPEDAFAPEGAVYTAACEGSKNAVQWMLQHGAKINHVVKGVNRCLALSSAARNGHLDVVKMLVEHGGNFNYVWAEHNPLSMAIMYNKKEVADYLRSVGAKVPGELDGWEPRKEVEAGIDEKAVLEHIHEVLGPTRPLALREILPTHPSIALHLVDAGGVKILISSGMSSKPQKVPKDAADWRYTELVLWLPGRWPLDEKSLSTADNYWPIEWLRRIALFPHQNQTWIGGPYGVFDNEDPTQPLGPGVKFTSVLIIASPMPYGRKQLPDGNQIVFYDVFPLYPEERELERQKGILALMDRFTLHRITAKDALSRKNVAID
jgi:hypothetical protein